MFVRLMIFWLLSGIILIIKTTRFRRMNIEDLLIGFIIGPLVWFLFLLDIMEWLTKGDHEN